ncbi:MAG: hypothetical protein ACFWTN_02445 [Clostridium sp.]
MVWLHFPIYNYFIPILMFSTYCMTVFRELCRMSCRFVKHIGQYGNAKIQKETTNEEDASAYY